MPLVQRLRRKLAGKLQVVQLSVDLSTPNATPEKMLAENKKMQKELGIDFRAALVPGGLPGMWRLLNTGDYLFHLVGPDGKVLAMDRTLPEIERLAEAEAAKMP